MRTRNQLRRRVRRRRPSAFACLIHEVGIFEFRVWEFRPRDLFLPYPAALGQAAKFFDRIEDDFVGDIGGDFDFADFPGKHKVYGSVLRFLIGLQARENFAGAHF